MERKLDDWVHGYLELNKKNEAPESYLTWTALSTIAAALKRKVVLKMGQQEIYPNMYVLLVGPPGKTRKGTAMKPARKMLTDIGIQLAADSTTRAQLIRRLRQSTDSEIDQKTGTVVTHSSITVFSPEFSVFLRKDYSQIIADLTDLYDCWSTWRDETKKDDEAGTLNDVQGPFINIIGATTPDLIKLNLPEDAIGGGLTSRMIFICESTKRQRTAFDTWVGSKKYDQLENNLRHDLECMNMLHGTYKFSERYLESYIRWYDSMEEDCPFDVSKFSGYWSRRQDHLRKISMICSASRSSELVLRQADFDRALYLLEKAEEKMPMVYAAMGRSQHADMIRPIMREIIMRKSVTKSYLMNKFIRDVSAWELSKILDALALSGNIEIVESGSGEYIKYIRKEEQNENGIY